LERSLLQTWSKRTEVIITNSSYLPLQSGPWIASIEDQQYRNQLAYDKKIAEFKKGKYKPINRPVIEDHSDEESEEDKPTGKQAWSKEGRDHHEWRSYLLQYVLKS
jgi:hypothetical protein